jgi:hypothetical protein
MREDAMTALASSFLEDPSLEQQLGLNAARVHRAHCPVGAQPVGAPDATEYGTPVTLWLGTLPSWLSFLGLVLFWNGLALLSMRVFREWSRREGVVSGPPVVNAWATCVGSLTALLFAFTVVTLWNQSVTAAQNVEDEATAMRNVARDLLPAQLPLLASYVRQTLDEWPQLCGGTERPEAEASLQLLEHSAVPSAERYGDNLYQRLGMLEDLRNRRWQVSGSSLPGEIGVALAVLSVALLAVLGIAMPDHAMTHLLLMLAIGTAIGTLFWVSTLLQYPFCGSNAIRPSEIATILRHLP